MASAVVSTLRHVTERKLQKLAEQQSHYESKRSEILRDAGEQTAPTEKLEAVIKGIKRLDIPVDCHRLSLTNLEMFLAQSRHDSSVPVSLLEKWRKELEHELEHESVRYGFASLFGRLVTEWLENPNESVGISTEPQEDRIPTAESDALSSSSFQELGREEMYNQRKEWESYTFSQRNADQQAIDDYLRKAFDSTLKSKKTIDTPIKTLQQSITNFNPISASSFNEYDLKSCIKGVLKEDLFTGEKREALVELLEKPLVLKEMADVMKMDLAAIDTWDWKQPVPVFMRRQVNGKYRAYMDEEIHDALLLHYVGVRWAVHLKETFKSFYRSGAWLTSTGNGMSKKYRARRDFFLGTNFNELRRSTRGRGRGGKWVRDVRRRTYQADYFMTQLPDNIDEGSREYEDSDRAETWGNNEASQKKSPTSVKQSLLRLATTEMLMSTKLYGEFTIVQTDFKWFGPSIPHDTLFAVLKFFGVTGKWLSFFRKFLQTPLVFTSDGPSAVPARRSCGVPISHVLSDALSEAVLFCLDFIVNQKTGGANLYRFHDDVWFWGQEKTCIEAWKAIQEFTSIMGLDLNDEKTGAALILGSKVSEAEGSSKPNKEREISHLLPKGDVKWGFLTLDTIQHKWDIDRKQVDEHIVELRRQLDACRSLFAWIQAWNSYVTRFLSTNFAQPANCFGRDHVNMVMETFKHIQHSLFKSQDPDVKDVTTFLRKEVKRRFGVEDIPDGFFYFPIALGGLELRNPLIPLLAIHAKSFKSSSERFDRAFETEEEDYRAAKELYEKTDDSIDDDGGWGGPDKRELAANGWKPENPEEEPFFSFDEFTAFREETSAPLMEAYLNLQEAPPEEVVQPCNGVEPLITALPVLDEGERIQGWADDWHRLSPYWKWVIMLYEAEVRRKVGGLGLCEKGLLPMGLVSLMRGERVRWLG